MAPSFKLALEGLIRAVDELERDAFPLEERSRIATRGHFRPAEDTALGFWFARFLTVRTSLWETLDDIIGALDKPVADIESQDDWRLFLSGYGTMCTLIRLDRFLLFELATHTVIQRKLNEPFPEYRIPAKQYKEIFSAYVDQNDAWMAYDAYRFAGSHRKKIAALSDDPDVGFLARRIDQLDTWLDTSKRNYFKNLGLYLSHKWRRRGVAGGQKVFARAAEGVGRAASNITRRTGKRVSSDVRARLAGLLEPGDVLVTRHDVALTNLFLPGFWPHAALYVGTAEQREELGLLLESDHAAQGRNELCVLEALKDGVLLRSLTTTLSVDCCAVLRPELTAVGRKEAIRRAVQHEGKRYKFDFDFFSSDALVCTEVVYRALDGLGGIRLPLTERADRLTLSAEDLLDYGLDTGRLTPVAVFGVDGCENELVTGRRAARLLAASYRQEGAANNHPAHES